MKGVKTWRALYKTINVTTTPNAPNQTKRRSGLARYQCCTAGVNYAEKRGFTTASLSYEADRFSISRGPSCWRLGGFKEVPRLMIGKWSPAPWKAEKALLQRLKQRRKQGVHTAGYEGSAAERHGEVNYRVWPIERVMFTWTRPIAHGQGRPPPNGNA